jgi:glycerol-3-phosphate acyltransferase PlsY
LGLTAISVFFGLMLVWMVLATLYCIPVWLTCLFTNRDVSLGASWRVAGAALMPGALVVSLALALYETGELDVLQFTLAFGLHLIIGWVYLFLSPMFLNRVGAKARKNPFLNRS